MGFWQEFPGPSWFHFLRGMLVGSGGIIRAGPPNGPAPPASAGIRFGSMEAGKESSYREFLRKHYRIAAFSYFEMPAWDAGSWIGVEARTLDGELVGTVVSVAASNQQPAIIDMFCVSPSYRGSGIASRLLWEIDSATARAGRLAHKFMKEGSPLWWLPPLAAGRWVFRRSCPVAMRTPSETRVKFADTNWRTLPLGEPIGEVVEVAAGTTQEEIDAAADASGYKVVLSTEALCPSWEKDSYFFWYAYNWY